MTSRDEARSSNRLCDPAVLRRQRRSSRGSLTRTRLMFGRSGSRGRLSWLPVRIPVFAGHITRSSLITVAGTESTRITILAGMTAFIPVAAFADLTRQSLVTISSMAAIQQAQRSETMAGPTRSAWRPAQSGLLAVTWTRATAHRRHIWSAWNFSSRLTRSAARRTKATRPKHPILQSIPGPARSRRVVLSATSCKLPLKPRKLLVSKWWLPRVMPAPLVPLCQTRHRFMRRPTRWEL